MSRENQPQTTGSDDEPPVTAGKPYQKPSFVREQVFETMALACGKINPTSGPCKIEQEEFLKARL